MEFSLQTVKKHIHGLSRAEVGLVCVELGAPAYRGDQVWRWLYVDRVREWSAMTNLPAGFRNKLSASYTLDSASPVDQRGTHGETRKILAKLNDDETVELVIIPAPRRKTVCVSSQVGCRFKCAFCASGQAGFRRNLLAGEIVGELLLAAAEDGEKPTHVVFMGVGEPFDNYDEVLRAIRIMNDAAGLSIGARRITISTCGVVPGIERLAGEDLQVELSVSLHAADNELRSRLMPVNRKYPLPDLLEACRAYTKHTGRIITFEYTLIRGVNDSSAQAGALAKLLQVMQCRVNLIPMSSVEEYRGQSSSPEVRRMFINILERSGINATLRESRGGEVKAACGQLRAQRIVSTK